MIKKAELKVEYVGIDQLTPYKNNARKHEALDVDNIKKSIEKYGFNDPIGIYGKDNIIVEGHGRLMAAKALGMGEIPCVRLDHMTDEERREYAIAHNATAELSEWDFDALGKELLDLDLGDFDFNFDIYEETELDVSDDDFISDTEVTKSKAKTCKCPECGAEFEI